MKFSDLILAERYILSFFMTLINFTNVTLWSPQSHMSCQVHQKLLDKGLCIIKIKPYTKTILSDLLFFL